MLLRSALDGQITTPLVVIEDNLDCSGFPLLCQFIRKIAIRNFRLDIFCLDINTEIVKEVMNSCSDRVFYHPFYKNQTDCHDGNHSDLNKEMNLFDYYEEFCVKNKTSGRFAVIIDSLSLLLLTEGLNKTLNILQKFIEYSVSAGITFQLICLLHSDVHSERFVKSIEYLSTFIIRLKCSDCDDLTKATVINKKLNGGTSKEIVYYTIDSDVLQLADKKHFSKRSKEDEPTNKEQLLNSKLTFNLSLKEDEKQSRANVVLPYEKNNQIASGGGKIDYLLEPEDDFDEDDPDDDLDF